MITSYDIALRTGLDGPGGLQRPDNGLRHARRTHPAFISRRSQNRKGSISDLPHMPGHIPMQEMGDERPRSGVRSRRRRVNSEAALGDETMIREIAGAHREASIFVYSQHGRLHPKLWVESESVIALIEPESWEACDVTDWQRAQMLAAVRRSIDGLVVGRCDEVYIRDLNIPGGKRDGGQNLAEMVDFDPSIRTALMVHAMDCLTGETYMTMATFDLDNQGSPYWERHETGSYYATFAVPLWASVKMAPRTHRGYRLPYSDADDVALENRWVVTRLQK